MSALLQKISQGSEPSSAEEQAAVKQHIFRTEILGKKDGQDTKLIIILKRSGPWWWSYITLFITDDSGPDFAPFMEYGVPSSVYCLNVHTHHLLPYRPTVECEDPKKIISIRIAFYRRRYPDVLLLQIAQLGTGFILTIPALSVSAGMNVKMDEITGLGETWINPSLFG